MACDENVISYIGHEGKKEYALSLYEMAEYYSENFRLFNGFGKSAVVECKLCLNGMPVPLLRNCYSIFNGTKYR